MLAAAAIVAVGAVAAGAPLLQVLLAFAAICAAVAIEPASSRGPRPARLTSRRLRERARTHSIDPRILIDALDEPVLLVDSRLRIRQQNGAANAAFGATPPELGLRVKFRSPAMRELVETVVRDRRSQTLRGFEASGGDAWFDVHVAVLNDLQSDLRYVITFHDRTAARRDARIRSDFVANASHELRTPLTALTGYIETLQGPARNDGEARERFLSIMAEQARRMTALVNDLLSLSRLERRTGIRPRRPTDLGAVLRASVDAMAPAFQAEGVALETPQEARGLIVIGEHDELVQVVQNLLENALRYGASGGRVKLSAERGDKRLVRVSVTDWGPGIAAYHLPRLTERFYRVDVATSRARKGTGLGLAIVKHILSRHGSRLSIESSPGQGATFSFELPSAQKAQI